MQHYNMNLTLKVWRQKDKNAAGGFETYQVKDISSEMSFLEMFDVLNERLIIEGKEPIAFDHDCREGICGMCSMVIDGRPHGPWEANTTCQLHMRAYKDGDTIVVEPWRANSFPVLKDLMVDRGAFDRIIQAGGYISVKLSGARRSLEIRKSCSHTSVDYCFLFLNELLLGLLDLVQFHLKMHNFLLFPLHLQN
jgi:succinate dehydrogenase / fumarate reductase iron-sulfur subunit